MPTSVKLILYGTTFCHLCEQAEAVLQAIGVEAEHIDIAEDDALLEQYGVRIPVVKREDTGAELGWPFNDLTLKKFLK
ncbi:MAG: glutaredoxin family protein [Sideroxydans sp.]|nr:glutaredoxin family protein [Sideroxydans sp.]